MLLFRRVFLLRSIQSHLALLKRAKSDQTPTTLDYNQIKHRTKVPLAPVISTATKPTEKISIDKPTLELLERLSLVNLSDKEALQTLEESIEFATKILHINTTNVEPLYFVNEEQSLELREDKVTEGNIRDNLLKNAPITGDDCFVAPPGNIPVELNEKNF